MWRKRVTALFEVKLSISVKILSTVVNGRGLKIQCEDYQVYRCIDKNHNCFKQYHITVKTKHIKNCKSFVHVGHALCLSKKN